jgi:hypothetical protein
LTAHALRVPEGFAMSLLRYADLGLLVLALPLFVLAGWPLAGWATGAGAWIAQRAIQLYAARRATASRDPRKVAGWLVGSLLARGWLVALTILGVGLGDNDAGLAAAVLVIALFTFYFTMQMLLRLLDSPEAPG